jgi:tetratricopeptide (TPR) repeat protein
MKCVLFLAAVLALTSVASAGDKDKSDKNKNDKGKPAAAASSPSGGDSLKQAEQKEAAGDHAGALALLKQAVAVPGTGGEAALRLGKMLEADREVEGALEAYKSAGAALTGAAKGEALARLALMQEIRGAGDPSATAQEAATADPEGAWPKVALSRARAREKKADEAKTLAQAATTAGAAATAALGFAEEMKPDDAAAEASYRKALTEEAGRIDATIGLARVLRKTGRGAEAEPLLKTLIEKAPSATAAYKESARVKLALGRPNEASADALAASSLAEGDAEARRLINEIAVERALADGRKGDVAFALQRLSAMLQQDPQSAELQVGIGRLQILKRDPAAAIAALQAAQKSAPDNAEAHFQMGYALHALKQDAAGALPELEKAAALEPDNLEYHVHLGAVLSEQQQFARAETELLKVTSNAAYNKPDAWIYLGGAYLNAKKYNDAVKSLDKALALAPDVPMANAYMAWSYFGLKDADNFKKYGAKARTLGYKDARFLGNLTRVEAGEPIK